MPGTWSTIPIQSKIQRHITDYQNIFNRAKFALKGAKFDNRRTTDQQLFDYTEKRRAKILTWKCYTSNMEDIF